MACFASEGLSPPLLRIPYHPEKLFTLRRWQSFDSLPPVSGIKINSPEKKKYQGMSKKSRKFGGKN